MLIIGLVIGHLLRISFAFQELYSFFTPDNRMTHAIFL
jgi:hypothetical protein